MGTLLLIQKQTTSVEVMRSLYLLSFFVIFASVQPLLLDNHRRPTKCYSRSFELIPEGNVVGRGFKNWDNYTQAKCTWVCYIEEKCLSYEFSPREKRCNLNKESEPTDPRGKFGDHLFCRRGEGLGFRFACLMS